MLFVFGAILGGVIGFGAGLWAGLGFDGMQVRDDREWD